jgi:chemotaxis signal transduction protein
MTTPLMPNDTTPDASPIELAARLNQYTPRSSGAVGVAAPPLVAALPAAPDAPLAGHPAHDDGPEPLLAFRDRVRDREGSADLLLFRVGGEIFGLPLASVEEAVEIDVVHPVPEGSAHALGVVELRGRMIPLYTPARPLGVAPAGAPAMLVLRDGARRVGIAIDDIDDVLTADLAALRPAPDGDVGDGVLLAMARRGADLVGVLDVHLLLAACLAESRTPETPA